MLTQILAGGGLLAALLLIVLVAIKQGRKTGHAEGELKATRAADDKLDQLQNEHNVEVQKQNEAVVANLEEVHETHDRLNHDPEYAQRVRDRFTRD